MRLLNASLPKQPATGDEVTKMVAAGRATGLPGIVKSLWFNRQTLKVRGKWLVCARQRGIYVMVCPLPEKDALIEAAPEIYFDTDHHAGQPAVLAFADKISPEDLAQRITRAWYIQAPKEMHPVVPKTRKTKAAAKAKTAKAKPRKPKVTG
jgi:hypothetical protein